jgi:hypothetical protein
MSISLPRIICLISLLYSTSVVAQNAQIALTERMIAVTNEFLESLTRLQNSKGVYDFDHEERLNWHFIPKERNGVVLRSMSDEQRAVAERLLRTFFSASGYAKAEAIRNLETVLAEIEVNGRFERDPELYYITVFGEPSMETNWGLRYEGHHLAFNWTFVRGLGVASTPQFFGSNPADVRSGARFGTRVLAAEEELGRDLLRSMSASQRDQAVIEQDVPRDIITGSQKQVSPFSDSGIPYSQLDSRQQQILVNLIDEVASVQAQPVYQQRMALIQEQGMDAVRFTWIGSSDRGEPHYYRVQGPGFLIEYDNTQNGANHAHLVWRDFAGDFGRDLLRAHYDAVAARAPEHGH